MYFKASMVFNKNIKFVAKIIKNVPREKLLSET